MSGIDCCAFAGHRGRLHKQQGLHSAFEKSPLYIGTNLPIQPQTWSPCSEQQAAIHKPISWVYGYTEFCTAIRAHRGICAIILYQCVFDRCVPHFPWSLSLLKIVTIVGLIIVSSYTYIHTYVYMHIQI